MIYIIQINLVNKKIDYSEIIVVYSNVMPKRANIYQK